MPVEIIKSPMTAELAQETSFLELTDTSTFPPISVVRIQYPDTTSAFIDQTSLVEPLSIITIYPRFSQMIHITNFDETFKPELDDIEDQLVILNGIIGPRISGESVNMRLRDIETAANSIITYLNSLTASNNIIAQAMPALTAATVPLTPITVISSGSTTSASVDILNYRNISAQIIFGVGTTGTITIQTSNDDINWFNEITVDKSEILIFEGVALYIRAVSNLTLGSDVKVILAANRR